MKDTINVEKLNEKIFVLQSKIDSLVTTNNLNKLHYEINEKQNIITQVNDFYDTAWLKLIVVISILGILVPLIVQYFQRKNLNDFTESIRKQMNENLEFKIEELKSFNKVEIEKTILELRENINNLEIKNNCLTSQIEASLFFLQGQSSYKSKEYVEASKDFFRSVYYWLETERIDRIKVMFNNLYLPLNKLNSKEELDNLEELINTGLKMSIEELIEHFKNHNYYPIYDKKLSQIIEKIESLRNKVI